MPTINIEGYEIEVYVTDFDKGCPPYRKGHPDNYSEGEPATIEFEFAEENELFNEILTEKYYQEAENQLLAKMGKA